MYRSTSHVTSLDFSRSKIIHPYINKWWQVWKYSFNWKISHAAEFAFVIHLFFQRTVSCIMWLHAVWTTSLWMFGYESLDMGWSKEICRIMGCFIASDMDAFPKQPRTLNSPSWRTGPTCRCQCFPAQTVFLSAREISFWNFCCWQRRAISNSAWYKSSRVSDWAIIFALWLCWLPFLLHECSWVDLSCFLSSWSRSLNFKSK